MRAEKIEKLKKEWGRRNLMSWSLNIEHVIWRLCQVAEFSSSELFRNQLDCRWPKRGRNCQIFSVCPADSGDICYDLATVCLHHAVITHNSGLARRVTWIMNHAMEEPY
jgi:hypothetical protein